MTTPRELGAVLIQESERCQGSDKAVQEVAAALLKLGQLLVLDQADTATQLAESLVAGAEGRAPTLPAPGPDPEGGLPGGVCQLKDVPKWYPQFSERHVKHLSFHAERLGLEGAFHRLSHKLVYVDVQLLIRLLANRDLEAA
ncbi:MAG: hypothetical protein AAGD06_32050 [Acidobacteriota bacterium]